MYSIHCDGQMVVLCLSFLLIGHVVSKPDGAPTAACDDMAPQHFAPASETSTSPFAITVAKVSRS